MKLLRHIPVSVVVLVLSIAGAAVFLGAQTKSVLKQGAIAPAELLASIVSRQIGRNVEARQIDAVLGMITPAEIRATLVDDEHEVIADSDPGVPEDQRLSAHSEIDQALRGSTALAVRVAPVSGTRQLFVAVPTDLPDIGSLVLLFEMGADDLDDSIRSLYTRIATTTVLLLSIVLFVLALLSERLSQMLETMRIAVERFSRYDLDYPSPRFLTRESGAVLDSIRQLVVTRQQEVEEIARRRDELQAVLASMIEAVIVLDHDLRILDMNPAAYALLDPKTEAPTGKSLLYVFRNTDILAFAERTLASESPVKASISMYRDREIHLQAHGTVLMQSDRGRDEQPSLVLVLNDITELTNLERVRKDFVANVSHELKTPITTIKGYIETLIEGDYRNEEHAERFLGITLTHIDRLNAIIEDLLSLSRLEQSNGEGPEFEFHRIDAILEEVVRACHPRASQKQIDLELVCPEGLAGEINPLLFGQAITNLVDNAIKYSATGTRVMIEATEERNRIAISVTDEGRGIPASDIPRIFERFYRVDKARSRDLGGTGLGLAIVKHIALAHRGTVGVTSREGTGSVFTMTIPTPSRGDRVS